MSKIVYLLIFLVLLIQLPLFSYSPPPIDQPSQTDTWQNSLQNLLEHHGLLLNQIIIASANDKPKNEIDSIKQKLLDNAHDLAIFFDLHLGPQAGQEFEPLFDDHIKFGGEYITATKNHQSTDKNIQKALENAKQIANLFHKWFPFIPITEWVQMWSEHVKLEAKQVDAYFQKNEDLAVRLKDQTLSQLNHISKKIIKGIKRR